MWHLLSQSTRGTSHARTGEPCQDACYGASTRSGEETVLVLACADGAGSAPHADRGAKLACATLTRLVFDAFDAGDTLLSMDRSCLVRWYAHVREVLRETAAASGHTARDYACTLLTALVGERVAVFAQVGDGAMVLGNEGDYRPVFWPQTGEFANTTHFVTGPFEDVLEFCQLTRRIDEVALFTDGLQMLALQFATRTAHAPFFAPMFRQLRACKRPEELNGPLRDFLESEAVNRRTEDDKTLMLAVRCPPYAS